MGQQQLLLIILVTVVVGIATIVAINVMQETFETSNREAVTLDIVAAMTNAQKYYFSPPPLGGGGRSFNGINIGDLSLTSENQNGTYELTGTGQQIVVTGRGTHEAVYVKATATMGSNKKLSIDWVYEEE